MDQSPPPENKTQPEIGQIYTPNQNPDISHPAPYFNQPVSIPNQPIMVNDHDYSIEKRRLNKGIFVVLFVIFLLAVASALYFWYLPASWSSSYINGIKQPYLKQKSQLTLVYNSLNVPMFSSAYTTDASNTKPLNSITAMISKAISANNLLAATKLTVLPGTTWQRSVSSAYSKYQNVQQYVTESSAFLTNYQNLVSYIKSYVSISQVYDPQIQQDLKAIGNSTAATIVPDLQNITSPLQKMVSRLKTLKPSTDLATFNSNMISDLSNFYGTVVSFEADAQNHSASNLYQQIGIFKGSLRSLSALLTNNPTANLQSHSSLHDQYILLLQDQTSIGKI